MADWLDELGTSKPVGDGSASPTGAPTTPTSVKKDWLDELAVPTQQSSNNPARDLASRQLKNDEGIKLEAYEDPLNPKTGPTTIGYGHTDPDVKKGMKITQQQADELHNKDLDTAEKAARTVVPNYDQLSPERQAAFINMAYQMGAKGLADFKNTIAAAQKGDWNAVANSIIASKYAQQTPGRAARVAEQLRTGQTPESTVDVTGGGWDTNAPLRGNSRSGYTNAPSTANPGEGASFGVGVVRGVGGMIAAPIQLAGHAIKWMGGTDVLSNAGDKLVNLAENYKKQDFETQNPNASAAGKVIAPIVATAVTGGMGGPVFGATRLSSLGKTGTMMDIALSAGKGASVAAATNPVHDADNENDYWSQKGKQAALGAAAGTVSATAGKLVNTILNKFKGPDAAETFAGVLKPGGYSSEDQYLRKDVLKRIGINEPRQSAITGDISDAAYDAAKASKPNDRFLPGKSMRETLDSERQAMINQSNKIDNSISGPVGQTQAAQSARGTVIQNFVRKTGLPIKLEGKVSDLPDLLETMPTRDLKRVMGAIQNAKNDETLAPLADKAEQAIQSHFASKIKDAGRYSEVGQWEPKNVSAFIDANKDKLSSVFANNPQAAENIKLFQAAGTILDHGPVEKVIAGGSTPWNVGGAVAGYLADQAISKGTEGHPLIGAALGGLAGATGRRMLQAGVARRAGNAAKQKSLADIAKGEAY